MSAPITEGRGKRCVWVIETRTRLRYPRFGSRKVARWGKWSAWRPDMWCDRGGRRFTRQDAREMMRNVPRMYTEQFRIVRYAP